MNDSDVDETTRLMSEDSPPPRSPRDRPTNDRGSASVSKKTCHVHYETQVIIFDYLDQTFFSTLDITFRDLYVF